MDGERTAARAATTRAVAVAFVPVAGPGNPVVLTWRSSNQAESVVNDRHEKRMSVIALFVFRLDAVMVSRSVVLSPE